MVNPSTSFQPRNPSYNDRRRTKSSTSNYYSEPLSSNGIDPPGRFYLCQSCPEYDDCKCEGSLNSSENVVVDSFKLRRQHDISDSLSRRVPQIGKIIQIKKKKCCGRKDSRKKFLPSNIDESRRSAKIELSCDDTTPMHNANLKYRDVTLNNRLVEHRCILEALKINNLRRPYSHHQLEQINTINIQRNVSESSNMDATLSTDTCTTIGDELSYLNEEEPTEREINALNADQEHLKVQEIQTFQHPLNSGLKNAYSTVLSTTSEKSFNEDKSAPPILSIPFIPHLNTENEHLSIGSGSICGSNLSLGQRSSLHFSEITASRFDEYFEKHCSILLRLLKQELKLALDAWNGVAREYQKRIEPLTSQFVPHLMDCRYLVPLASNDHELNENCYLQGKSVLDVATGTGAAALYAVSKGANSVTATDFSIEMLKTLDKRICIGRDLLETASFECSTLKGAYKSVHYPCDPSHVLETKLADGQCLPSNWTDQYDIVCSNFGVIYFPQLHQGLAEMVRCAKPGGKVCFSGWGSKDETQAFSIFPKAMKYCGFVRKWVKAQSASRRNLLSMAGVEAYESETFHYSIRGEFQKCNISNLAPNYFCPTKRISSSNTKLHSLMESAGLKNIKVIGPITQSLQLDNAEEYWYRFVLASPNLKRAVEECFDEEEISQLKRAVIRILEEESFKLKVINGEKKNQIVLNASAYITFGTKTK